MRRRKLIIALLFLVALGGACAWLAGTTSGLRFLAARALPYLPVALDTADIEGRLVGPLSLGPIELATPELSGTIESVALDWRPSALLRRTLHIDSLIITGPRLRLDTPVAPPDDPPADDASPFSLPINVVLDHLALVDGELRSADEVVLDDFQLALAGQAAGQQVTLYRLALNSNQGALSGHAHISLAAGDAWDIDLAWQLALAGEAHAGHTRVTGPLAELDVTQEISAPLTARLEGVVRGLPAAPAWDLALALEPLPSRPTLWPAAVDALAAELRLEGGIADSRIMGHFTWPAQVAGRIDLEAQLGWLENVLRLRHLELRLQDGAQLTAAGRFEPGDEPAAEFTVDGVDLGWPLGETVHQVEVPRFTLRGSGAGDQWDVTATARARQGELPEVDIDTTLQWADALLTVERLEIASLDDTLHLTAHGSLDTADDRLDYRISAAARADLPDYPRLDATLTATGDAQGLRVETLTAQLLDGTVAGAGRIAWTGDEAADFHLEFTGLDPATLAPGWPGRLAGQLELRGLPTAPDGLELTLHSLRGELRSLPVDATASLNISDEVYLLRELSLAVGGASLQADGRLDPATVRFEAALEAPALDDFDAAARGELSATARIDGPRSAPRIALAASGSRLRWQNNRARAVRIEGMVDASGAEPSNILAELDGLALAPGPGMQVRLAADGLPGDHHLHLQIDRQRPGQQFILALRGALADQRWEGQLTELSLAEEEQPVWALQSPADLIVDAAAVALHDACMDGTLGLLCVDADWRREGPWRGSATLAELDLGPLSDWLGAGLSASGVVTGEIEVQADEKMFRRLSGGLELTVGDLRVASEETAPLLSWDGGRLELDGDEDEARLRLRLDLAEGDRLDGRLAVGWNADDPPLDGQLDAELQRLGLIAELVPDLADLRGRATATASLSGTFAAPVLAARFEWQDGTAEVPTLGLRPEAINVVATLEERTLGFTATGRSGDGNFELEGEFDLHANAVEGRATLQGENVLLAALPEARVTASPDLRFRYTENRLTVGGDVNIPFARITGLGGPTAISASPDEVIVGPRARPEEEGLRVASMVRVTVGPDVQVRAAGLRGSVEGDLRTVIEPQALPWGRGELRVVDGTFGVLGQRLEIETGRLIYTGGPLDNPGLEIRAVRRVDTITAGALVRGTLKDPEISVYSDPPMPSAEVLSYLTLGKGLDELQSGEQQSLNQAANTLALSGGGLIAKDLGRKLGLDDVSVSADDDAGTALVVGKYLGGGLYVSYGLGLFDAVNTLRLRFQISQRLSLEAKSGEESAADLFYTIERD
ncbi:MAG: translocation/assembly module TamB domain-containing protein [Gammaproteobacteria bacterium]